MSEATVSPAPPPISGLVAMIHVTDIERSAAFYRLLGFEIGNSVPLDGALSWAWLYAPGAPDWKRGPNLMLTRDDRPINPGGADALFYVYTADLAAMRDHLLAAGIRAGAIKYPGYLPNGEFRIHDPDGYIVMIAQAAADTP